MEDIKYQIFISSTYEDLENERDKVIETILNLYHLPVGMEMFSAGDEEQWTIIKDTIISSDYYIVIIGHRYGSENEQGVSYTEMEYDFAKENEIPILAFIKKRDVPTKPNERDNEIEKQVKLEQFIEKAKKSKMCDFWETDEELSKLIAIALPKTFKRQPREGWIRSSKAVSPALSAELAQLSKENRELRKTVEDLQATLGTRAPDIILDINSSSHISLNFSNIPINSVKYPNPIESIPSHLEKYINQKEVEKYNNNLPTDEEVDNYNEELKIYGLTKQFAVPLTFTIRNDGNIKANQVYVDISFPDGVLVSKSKNVENYTLPANPIPNNPLKKAENEYEIEVMLKKNPLYALKKLGSNFINPLEIGKVTRIDSASYFGNKNVNINHWTKLEKNKITIKINSILHTKKIVFDDEYIITPIDQGNFNANISIICEEYEESIKIDYPIEVKEQ